MSPAPPSPRVPGGAAPGQGAETEPESQTRRLVLELAVSAARVGTFDLDVASGTLVADDRMVEVLGLPRGGPDPTLEAFRRRLHPDDAVRVGAAVATAIESGGAYEAEHRIVRPDGQVRWISSHGRALRDRGGVTTRLLGACCDTTAVHEEAGRSTRILETMSAAFYSLDTRWRFTYLNAPAEALLGVSREDAVGQVVWDLFPAAADSAIGTTYRAAAASGRPATFEAHYPAPLDAWYEIRVWPSAEGLSVFFLDVTARRRAQEDVARSTRRVLALSQVTAALAGAQDITDLVTTMAERGLAAMGCDGGAVAVPDPDDPGVLLSYITTSYGPGARADFGRLPVDAALPVCEAYTSGRPVLVPDLAAAVAYSPLMQQVVAATGSPVYASLPLRADGRVIGVLTAGWKDPQPFDAEQLDLLNTFAAQCAQALQRMSAREAERTATAQQAALVAVARALGEADTEEDVFAVVAGEGLGLLGAAGSALCLREPDGRAVRILASSTLDADVRARLEHLPADSPLPLVRSATTGDAHFLTDLAETAASFPGSGPVHTALRLQASASVPLRARGHLLGSVSMGFARTRPWPRADQDLVGAFATLTAQALERIAAREAERTASASVARFSETLQRSLLTQPAEPDHLQIAVRYSPAAAQAQVGGDWYDAFLTSSGSTRLAIGDVTGHDQQAAAAMGQLRNLLRGIGYAIAEPPARVLSVLDRAAHDLAVGAMATVVLAQVEQTPEQRAAGLRTLRWSNAGHPPPLLVTPEGTTSYLTSRPELLLGLDPGTTRTDHEVVLRPGSSVLLFTDGLVERRGTHLQEGLDWLARAVADLAHLPLDDLCDALLAQVGNRVEDDVALLALRAHPEDAPRPAEAGPGNDPRAQPPLVGGRSA